MYGICTGRTDAFHAGISICRDMNVMHVTGGKVHLGPHPSTNLRIALLPRLFVCHRGYNDWSSFVITD